MLLLVIALFVFAYHYERNGDPWTLGDFLCRITWAVSFSAGYICATVPDTNYLLAIWFAVGAFLEILIPHAFAQRMGNRSDEWTTLPWSKYWSAYWLTPFLTTTTFLEQDFIGMSCTGLLRGLIVFVPPYLLGWTSEVVVPAVITMMWQPLSYVVGWVTPWTIWTNPAKSSQWGEFYIGIGWAIALWVSLCH